MSEKTKEQLAFEAMTKEVMNRYREIVKTIDTTLPIEEQRKILAQRFFQKEDSKTENESN